LHQLTPKAKKEIFNILKKYQKDRNLTIIMITHDLEDTLYSDRIVIMNQGNIYLDGLLEEVYSNKDKILTLGFDLPFVVKLSYRLIEEKIIDKVYTNMMELVDELWQ
jgi:energy-coupling factor transport system ATP-binding protein